MSHIKYSSLEKIFCCFLENQYVLQLSFSSFFFSFLIIFSKILELVIL